MSNLYNGFFPSLEKFNYRIWLAGAFVSDIGTWVQRTAQSWLVLTILTDHSATAIGTVTSLQFGPQLFLVAWTGYVADHFDHRKILICTQATMGLLALTIGALIVSGFVQFWHVLVFAALLGSVSAFDAPVRQIFAGELVGDTHLANAVALNSASFYAARMIGPAVAGLIIAEFGTGWAFLINGASFGAVVTSIFFLRLGDLRMHALASRKRASVTEGFRYILSRPDLKAVLVMLFLVGTFGLNFSIYIPTMAVGIFHAGAREYGLLTASMAVGTVTGALLSAGRSNPSFRTLVGGSSIFGLGCTLAALAPSTWTFAAALFIIGIAILILTNTSNSLMQLSTEPAMRGRVMASIGAAYGGTPIGAPIVGRVADHLGPRWALGVAAASGFGAVIVGMYILLRKHRAG
uniref:MFS transporter n=1 Tax=Methylobacterium oryzae TaxID=334852 RepID=UPI00155DD153|nr:MFS transporter [Methylobacterium oryzae]